MYQKKLFLVATLVGLCILYALPVLAVGVRGIVPEIEMIKVNEKPVIDGELNDKAWVEVARSFKGVLTGWKNQTGTSLIRNQRIVYLCYDDEALYIGMTCYVDDIERLRYGNDVWHDDELEVHLENEDGEYFQMGIDCSGAWDIGMLDKIFRFESASKIGGNFWSTEIAIPWKEVRVAPTSGTEIGFNVAGNDYLDGWVTWGPTYGSFHQPKKFCYLRLRRE